MLTYLISTLHLERAYFKETFGGNLSLFYQFRHEIIDIIVLCFWDRLRTK